MLFPFTNSWATFKSRVFDDVMSGYFFQLGVIAIFEKQGLYYPCDFLAQNRRFCGSEQSVFQRIEEKKQSAELYSHT